MGGDFLDRILGRDAVFLPQHRHIAMFDKFIRPPDAFHGGVDPLVVKEFDDRGAEAIGQDVILEGAHDLALAGGVGDELGVQRLDEAGIDQSDGVSLCFEGILGGHREF